MEPVNRYADGWTQAINTVGLRTVELPTPTHTDSTTSSQEQPLDKVMGIRKAVLDHYKEWVTKPVENLKRQFQEKSNHSTTPRKSFIPVTALGLDCSTKELLGKFQVICVFAILTVSSSTIIILNFRATESGRASSSRSHVTTKSFSYFSHF